MRNLLLSLALFAGSVMAAQAATLNVMTSYPQPVVATFQEAFENAYPDVQLNILWRRPDDALKVLEKTWANGVDVVWMPSITTFSALAKGGLLHPAGVDLTGLPQAIGNMPISDKQQRYLAFEIAGYGMFVDKQAITQAGLTMPHSWHALTQPQWQGKVALPIPSQLGFAPMMIDQLLQAQGWEKGWNFWRRIAANSQLVGRNDPFITDEVQAGKAAVGLMMDFFAFTAIQHPDRYQFIYPEQTAFSPAHVGITASAQQRQLAQTFVRYLLSEQGQSLLLQPDVRRLPVRVSLYDSQQLTANPFLTKTAQFYDYDKGKRRRNYVAMLFDAGITDSHDLLVKSWSLLQQLENDPAFSEHAQKLALYRQTLMSWPVPEPDNDADIATLCAENNGENLRCQQQRQRLSAQFSAQYQQVIDALQRIREGQ